MHFAVLLIYEDYSLGFKRFYFVHNNSHKVCLYSNLYIVEFKYFSDLLGY